MLARSDTGAPAEPASASSVGQSTSSSFPVLRVFLSQKPGGFHQPCPQGLVEVADATASNWQVRHHPGSLSTGLGRLPVAPAGRALTPRGADPPVLLSALKLPNSKPGPGPR